MKQFGIVILLASIASISRAQTACLGANKAKIREVESSIYKNTFLESSLTNKGEEMDVYAFGSNTSPQLVFYYDIRDTCRGYKILLKRNEAPKLIDGLKSDYKRVDNLSWLSNDNQISILMNVNDDGIVEFYFERIEDMKKDSLK